jgi:hypothetical protein
MLYHLMLNLNGFHIVAPMSGSPSWGADSFFTFAKHHLHFCETYAMLTRTAWICRIIVSFTFQWSNTSKIFFAMLQNRQEWELLRNWRYHSEKLRLLCEYKII